MSSRKLSSHKFKVGQTVDFSPSRQSMPASAREYKVVRLMPTEGIDIVYRVKCATEPFERIAKENELSLRS